MKRIPLNSISKAVYQLLTNHQTVPVYDDVPQEAATPYITMGTFTCKANEIKNNDLVDATLNMEIWSQYQGKKEVNSIADDIITLLSAATFDLSEDGFACLGTEVDFFESYPEEDFGYHGILTIICKIQNME